MARGGLAYGFWQKEEGIVGVTPESLFRRLGGGFHIDAGAGTGVGGEGWVPSPKDRL